MRRWKWGVYNIILIILKYTYTPEVWEWRLPVLHTIWYTGPTSCANVRLFHPCQHQFGVVCRRRRPPKWHVQCTLRTGKVGVTPENRSNVGTSTQWIGWVNKWHFFTVCVLVNYIFLLLPNVVYYYYYKLSYYSIMKVLQINYILLLALYSIHWHGGGRDLARDQSLLTELIRTQCCVLQWAGWAALHCKR